MKKLITLLFVLLSLASFGQIVLETTSTKLQVTTTTTAGIDYEVTFVDETTAGGGIYQVQRGKITTATTTDILAVPNASTSRVVQRISAKNISTTVDNTLAFVIDVSATDNANSVIYTLKPGEHLEYNGKEWTKYTAYVTSSVTGLTKSFGKTGTASDAAAYWYGYWKDAGVIGAWAPGTPGLAGRVTNGTSATDAGCIFFPNAGAGKVRYLTNVTWSGTVAHSYFLYDVLWVNSGLVVTTTTGQTINSVTLPARDDNGSTNGEGCSIGIYAVAALGNAGVVSNSTVTYTNSAGTASRTATLSATVPNNFPATPVIGTVVWFELQAGDTGVQSIQTVTLNTTLTSGTASVFIARRLAHVPVSVANVGFQYIPNNGTGVVLYDNACILPFVQTSATTATVINGTVTTCER